MHSLIKLLNKNKIAIVSNHPKYHVGGIEVFLDALTKNLKTNMLDFYFIRSSKRSEITVLEKQKIIHYCSKEYYSQITNMPKIFGLFLSALHFLYEIVKLNPDVVIQMGSGYITGLSAIYSFFFQKPMIFITASDKDLDFQDPTWNKRSVLQKNLYKIGIFLSTHIVAISEAHFQKVTSLKRRKSNLKNISYIPNGIPNITPIKPKDFLNKNYIFWIGRFNRDKNPEGIIPIANAFPDLKFIICGPNNDEFLIKKWDEISNITYLGFLKSEEIRYLMKHSLALLSTSILEGFPNTFIESFSVGTPILSIHLDPSNIISKNKLGIVSNDISTIQKFIENLMDDQFRYKISTRCLTFYEENYKYKTIVQKYRSLLEKYLPFKSY